MIEFPKKFLWGAATSSHQVEGDNLNSDWWRFEQDGRLKEASGAACRHYELYKQDFDLARQLNHNSHRFSIEWSRIEPEEGRFSQEEISHYNDVILSLGERNIEPIVTLHHFTNPLWFSKIGGWQNRKALRYFTRYAEKIAEAFCTKVNYWVTINEPNIYVYQGHILGIWPPQEISLRKAKDTWNNLAAGHIAAYRAIHDIYRKNNLPSPLVSIAQNLQAFVVCAPTLKNRIVLALRNRFYNFSIIEKFIRSHALDYIGINYYSRNLIDVEKWGIRNLAMDGCSKGHHPLEKNSLGWDIYPQGLYDLLIRLKRYKLPLFILENGICTLDDTQRWNYIYQHLKKIHLAIAQGVPVLGYIHWSLLDNFEWDKGFEPRFGLIEVDYRTFKRTVRQSALKFAEVCRTGKL